MFARIGIMRALNRNARSTRRGRQALGKAASWRGINDESRKVSRHQSCFHEMSGLWTAVRYARP
jgi:hypothetical protein